MSVTPGQAPIREHYEIALDGGPAMDQSGAPPEYIGCFLRGTRL